MSARISQAVLLDLRGRVFSHAQALSISFHERYTSGRVISRLTSDLDTLSDLAEQGLDGLISGVLSVVVISVVLLVLDLPLGLIAMAAFIPIFFLTRWFQRRSRHIYRRTRKAIASLIVQFMETMNGLRAVLAFRREARNEAIFSEFNTENARANGDGLVAIAQYSPFVRLVGNICLTVVMVVGAVRVIDGEMAIGVLAAFLLYVRRMYDPLDELAMFYNSYQSASAALEKISGLLEEVPAVPEPSSPAPSPAGGFSGAVQMSGVEFGYSTEHVGAAALRPDDPGRSDGGRGRRHRCREVDAGEVAGPLLRPDVGHGLAGRCRCLDAVDGRPAARRGDGHPGVVPVLRFGGRQHRARATVGVPRRDRGGRRPDRGRRVHPGVARRVRHRRAQARRPAVGRTASVGRRSPGPSWPTLRC